MEDGSRRVLNVLICFAPGIKEFGGGSGEGQVEFAYEVIDDSTTDENPTPCSLGLPEDDRAGGLSPGG
ncbi:hypothetical protein NliqN6_3476 [Naganishia liquefaciens]|uniref:Uncharacterized protein n=1 Tax=Naganishia liquefaciens TaxID=104408 RepID=A0A8H3TU30_9TREE|nr:hypothetical protein NliqN6_3476 [Naganishia liquefaciens]